MRNVKYKHFSVMTTLLKFVKNLRLLTNVKTTTHTHLLML
jgi:hypothetical protein